jgi:hypothetical protein
MRYVKLYDLSYTSPAAASTVAGDPIGGLAKFDFITVDATLVGATGGTLDIYLQRELGETGSLIWADWYHFAQIADSAAAASVTFNSYAATATTYPLTIGIGTLAAPGVAIAANTLATPTPGQRLRIVSVAGAGTSAGGAQKIYITGWEDH